MRYDEYRPMSYSESDAMRRLRGVALEESNDRVYTLFSPSILYSVPAVLDDQLFPHVSSFAGLCSPFPPLIGIPISHCVLHTLPSSLRRITSYSSR